jgi:hypothetical protein
MKYSYYVYPGIANEYFKENIENRENWKNTVPDKFKDKSWKYLDKVIENGNWNLFWSNISFLKNYDNLNIYNLPYISNHYKQIVSHSSMTNKLGFKNNLITTLKKYYNKIGQNVFDYIPISFYLKNKEN